MLARSSIALLALALLSAGTYAQETTVTRDGGNADWKCCADSACQTVLHWRANEFLVRDSCGALVKADGKRRWIASHRWRVDSISPTPAPSPTPTPTTSVVLTWSEPTHEPCTVEPGCVSGTRPKTSTVVNYRLSWGRTTETTEGSALTGNVLTYSVPNLTVGETWYFRIEALNNLNEYSARSFPASKVP